jgi:hypothetical protein
MILFKANPQAAQVRDNNGALPLHCALVFEASPSVIGMLHGAYPEAITVPNNYGQLPVDLYNGDNSEICNMLTPLIQSHHHHHQQPYEQQVPSADKFL